jgi:hypothetical protein
MLSLFSSFIISPENITAWAEALVIYLVALASAAITLATALLRFMNFATPIIERVYERQGVGEWRPKFWRTWDKATWVFQRVSGAGHLTRQTTIHAARRTATQPKEKRQK